MKKHLKNIPVILEALVSHFGYDEETTLKHMERERNPFKTLISCLLSLRTQDKNTEIASKRLFAEADTPEKIVNLSTEKLEELIYSSGHYRKKAQTLKHVSSVIIEKFNSTVPDTKEELMSIKGVGPKTANIVLVFAYGKPALPVDTHCHRIPNRLGWVTTKSPEKTEKELEKILPQKYWLAFNETFVNFGQTICLPISPRCSICPVENYCPKTGVGNKRR
jgi:endonuclease-3